MLRCLQLADMIYVATAKATYTDSYCLKCNTEFARGLADHRSHVRVSRPSHRKSGKPKADLKSRRVRPPEATRSLPDGCGLESLEAIHPWVFEQDQLTQVFGSEGTTYV